MKKLFYKILFWLTGTHIYLWSMKHVIPYIRFSLYYSLPENKLFPQWGALERKGYRILQPGDLIFTTDSKKFSSKIIGTATKKIGKMQPYFMPSHVAICVNVGSDFEIAEMTHLNFTKSTWEDVTRGSTRVVIARCSDWDKEYVEDTIVPMVKSFRNKRYDDRFTMGQGSLACSELPYFADLERRAKVSLEPILGNKPYITPVGWILGENIVVVWDSNAETL